jgi:hypothetical protein
MQAPRRGQLGPDQHRSQFDRSTFRIGIGEYLAETLAAWIAMPLKK